MVRWEKSKKGIQKQLFLLIKFRVPIDNSGNLIVKYALKKYSIPHSNIQIIFTFIHSYTVCAQPRFFFSIELLITPVKNRFTLYGYGPNFKILSSKYKKKFNFYSYFLFVTINNNNIIYIRATIFFQKCQLLYQKICSTLHMLFTHLMTKIY